MRAVQELLYYGPTVRSTSYYMLSSAYFGVTGALCTAPGCLGRLARMI